MFEYDSRLSQPDSPVVEKSVTHDFVSYIVDPSAY